MHTEISNNKHGNAQKKAILKRNGISGLKIDNKGVARSQKTNRPLVSTLTHTTRQVAEHFIKWRNSLKSSMIGHNGGPKVDDE